MQKFKRTAESDFNFFALKKHIGTRRINIYAAFFKKICKCNDFIIFDRTEKKSNLIKVVDFS